MQIKFLILNQIQLFYYLSDTIDTCDNLKRNKK